MLNVFTTRLTAPWSLRGLAIVSLLFIGMPLFLSEASAQSPAPSAAAPTVTGVSGCVANPGSTGLDGNGDPYSCGQNGNGHNMTYGTFATTSSVNAALSNLQNQINNLDVSGGLDEVITDGTTIVGNGTTANPIKLAPAVKNQLDANTTNISNLTNVVTGQGTRITNVEGSVVNLGNRITNVEGSVANHETRITNIEGAVTNLQTTVDDHSQWINNVNNGGGIKYFHANSTSPDSQATGNKTVAIGGGAVASHDNSVAIGEGSVTDRINSFSVGSDAQTRQITHVSAGTLNTDAVNVKQLKDLASTLGGGTQVSTDGTIIGPTYVVQNNNYNNVGDAITALDKSTANLDALAVKYDSAAKSSITLNAGGSAVKITNLAAGIAPTDAVNRSQLDAVKDGAVNYDRNKDGSKGQSVTLIGGNRRAPVLVRNVADGVNDLDAVNVRQLKRVAGSYTDSQVNQLQNWAEGRFDTLSGEIRDVRREARAAAAIGMATASLRYDSTPGKLSFAAGSGIWKGQGAYAMGVGYTTQDGIARFNISTTTSGGEWGVAGGMSFTLN
ncbi:YadA-like family protein [Microvirga puerhi]|uniref:YadA-like family protein n=1 Tax=Microvirga puerhi TaxID=2876078 RepID=A0ABS7VTP5_9HYPH|nr:YadA-like family protein [Microvirga puerhi]MBZ6078949.1 YadA-like family protein [Microvirga puerhi]